MVGVFAGVKVEGRDLVGVSVGGRDLVGVVVGRGGVVCFLVVVEGLEGPARSREYSLYLAAGRVLDWASGGTRRTDRSRCLFWFPHEWAYGRRGLWRRRVPML